MKTDVDGCSTTAPGQEQYEEYYDASMRGTRVQYDYRTPEGELFSCVAKSLEAARDRRDAWLVEQSGRQSAPPIADEPDIETLMAQEMEGVCEATDGCLVEPDGVCPHGHPSWLLHLGLI